MRGHRAPGTVPAGSGRAEAARSAVTADQRQRSAPYPPRPEQPWAPKDIVHVGAVLRSGAEPGDVELAQLSLLW